jgi:hypothetical protein
MNATKRILKKHVGRSCEVLGCNRAEGVAQHGRIDDVRNGIATICVYVVEEQDGRREHNPDGFKFLVPTNAKESRVVQIW